MRKDHEDYHDSNRPALIVLYGATRRKFRPLEGDIVVLGRSPGCDIGLVSPEVAPVHCVLVRMPTGWRIRDCSGRATRVNGVAIQDAPLRNGDTVQVGAFSFEAQLPPGSTPVPAALSALAVDRLQQSRRRLVELAITLRRRLREQTTDQHQQQGALARHQADLERMEHRLRQVHQEQLTRQAQLTEQEQAIAARREELNAFARHLRREADRLRQDAHDQVAQLEADLVAQRVEQRREADRLTQWQYELRARQAELERTATQIEDLLRQEREQVDRDREQVAREREYLSHERQEVIQLRADLERLKELLAVQTPAPVSSRETQLDAGPGARLESARRLLRELGEQRKPPELPANGSRAAVAISARVAQGVATRSPTDDR